MGMHIAEFKINYVHKAKQYTSWLHFSVLLTFKHSSIRIMYQKCKSATFLSRLDKCNQRDFM